MNDKLKTILIDDELPGLKILEHFCKEYYSELDVIGACQSPKEAINLIENLHPDLVIMDIQMPQMNAFELLNELKYKRFEIIFTTAHEKYAIQAFKYSATDYLLKPINEDLFDNAIRKVMEKLKMKSNMTNIETLLHNIKQHNNHAAMKICITDANGFQVVDIADILYCEAESCYTIFHLKNAKKIVSSKTMAEFEPILDENTFFRVHRSFIININHVVEYHKGDGGHVIMTNEQLIDVSRRKKNEFIFKMKTLSKG
jgi:two-component system, LytTR family, response regulator